MSPQKTVFPAKLFTYTGWAITALVGFALFGSAAMKFGQSSEAVSMFVTKLGYAREVIVPLGIVEVVCTLLYLIPSTTFLGAVLLTGYLGGATATHVRIAESFAAPLLLGVLVWLGLYLREYRARQLLPLRRPAATSSIG